MATVPQFTFDTRDVAPEHRFEAWRALVGVTHEVTAAGGDFAARVTSTTVDRMIVREMSAGRQSVERSARRIRADGLDHVVLHLTTDPFDFSTERGTRHAPAGAITVNTLSQPFRRSAAAERCSSILSLSRDLVAEVLPNPEDFHGTVLTGDDALLLATHMATLAQAAPAIAPAQADRIARASAHLLAAGLVPTRAAASEARRPLEAAALIRCKRHIERHLTEAGLTPDTICRQVGISRSALYRLFAPAGGVAQYIKNRRLLAARAALSGAGRTRRVSEIADRFGFGDAASFSRAFREAFGVSPSDVAGIAASLSAGIAERVPGTAETDIFAEWVRAVAP